MLQKEPANFPKNPDQLNLITFEIDISSPSFLYETTITCKTDLPPVGNKICFNLMDDYYLTITYALDTITNYLAGCQFLTQAKKNL